MTFVGVAGRDDEGPMRDFVARHDLPASMNQVIDTDGRLWARFGVSYQPAWAFVDDSGRVDVHAGPLYGDALVRRVEELLAS